MLTEYIQKKDEHRMERIFERYLRQGREPKIRHVLNQAMPYIDESFEGEAILSVGKSIDFITQGRIRHHQRHALHVHAWARCRAPS